MSVRKIVSIHLPLDMGAVGRILKVIADEFPDATVNENFEVHADDRPFTKQDRLAIVRRRASDAAEFHR